MNDSGRVCLFESAQDLHANLADANRIERVLFAYQALQGPTRQVLHNQIERAIRLLTKVQNPNNIRVAKHVDRLDFTHKIVLTFGIVLRRL